MSVEKWQKFWVKKSPFLMDHISVIFGAIFLKLTLVMHLSSVFLEITLITVSARGGGAPPRPK